MVNKEKLIKLGFFPQEAFVTKKGRMLVSLDNKPNRPDECLKWEEIDRETNFPYKDFNIIYWDFNEKVDSKKLYNDIVEAAKSIIKFRTDIEYKILALWIMSTWKKDKWSTIPHIAFLSRHCNRGKTEAWRFTKEITWHSFDATNKNISTIEDYSEKYNAAIFMDNINSSIQSKIREHIDISYKGKTTFYAINGTIELPESTYQRIIPFNMPKGFSEKQFQEIDFKGFRTRLMSYRYKNPDPTVIRDKRLKGRISELFTPIVSIAAEVDENIDDIIDFAENLKSDWKESDEDSNEYKILDIIKNHRGEKISYRKIIFSLGWDYKSKSDTIRFGKIISKMKFKIHKGNEGRYFFINKENKSILGKLYREYGIE